MRKKHTLFTIVLLSTFSLPFQSGIQQALAANEIDSTVKTATSTPFVPIASCGPTIVLTAHTGSKYPAAITMVVGQELAFKGNNALDLMTLRYHQISLNNSTQLKSPLIEIPKSGYKEGFLAVAPGETKIDICSNAMFYGLIPWRTHTVRVTVLPADIVHSVARSTTSIQE